MTASLQRDIFFRGLATAKETEWRCGRQYNVLLFDYGLTLGADEL